MSSLQDPLNILDYLPNEIIYNILDSLNPISILNFSHVNTILKKLINNEFWISYNSAHNYIPFEEKVSYFDFYTVTIKDPSPAKVAIAYYYYNLGYELYYKRDPKANQLLKKAAFLGLPLASKGHCWRCNDSVPFGGTHKKLCFNCIEYSYDTTKICSSCQETMPLSETSYCYTCSSHRKVTYNILNVLVS